MHMTHPAFPAVFISYSHRDQRFLDELLVQLKPLQERNLLDCWSDRDLAPGDRWWPEIKRALERAKIAVLMVSPDFLASRFIIDNELPPLLKAAGEGNLRILWVPVSASNYKYTEISDFQAVHSPSKPLDGLRRSERQRILVRISEEIMRAVDSSIGSKLHYTGTINYSEGATTGFASKQIAGTFDNKPFNPEAFTFDLPVTLDAPPCLLPVPCIIEGFGPEQDCLEALFRMVTNHFTAVARAERDAHEDAWSEALALADKIVKRKKIRQETSRQTAIRSFHSRLPAKLQKYKPSPLFLVVLGETGSGKTTILQNLAAAYRNRFIDLRDYAATETLASLALPLAQTKTIETESVVSRQANVLVLDALDKMTPGATHLTTIENVRQIRSVASGYPVVLIAARSHFFPSATEEQLRGATRVHLLPLDLHNAREHAHRQGQELKLDRAISRGKEEFKRMACKPLLLNLLIEMAKEGIEIAELVDDEHLFSRVVDTWLARDTGDSILQNAVRLKCMQRLALHALATGGRAISYSAIDALIIETLAPKSHEDVERFNADLRTCSFLRRTETDEFEFQHASFYEYCVARTAFEDLKDNEFSAVSKCSFNNDIVDFLVKRAEKSGRRNDLVRNIREVWHPDGDSTTVTNMLKMYSALEGNCWGLRLDGLRIENESLHGVKIRGERLDDVSLDLDGIELIRRAGKRTISNVSLIGCDLKGADLLDIHGHGWNIERCSLAGACMAGTRLDECRSIDSVWLVDDERRLRFIFPEIVRGTLGLVGRGSIDIRWGLLQSVEIFGSSREARGIIRNAIINDLSPSGAMQSWYLDDCSVDGFSLCKLSNCRRVERPRLSTELKQGLLEWCRGTPVASVASPRARGKPLREEGEFYSANVLSRTQSRKVGKALDKIRKRRRGLRKGDKK